MDTVTYPHDSVSAAIAESFVPFKVNLLERHPDFKEACAGPRVVWAPTFVIADPRGREVRRWTGWLPPGSFVGELAFCRAMAELGEGRFDQAQAQLGAIVESHGGTPIHPEALYWQGVAGYLAGSQDWAALGRAWKQLARDHPDSRFGTHASVIEDAPPEQGDV